MGISVRFVVGPLDGEVATYPHDVRPISLIARALLDDRGNRAAVAFYELRPGDGPAYTYAHSKTLDNEQFRKSAFRFPADD